MDAFTLRVLTDIAHGRVFVDGKGVVSTSPDTVVEPHDQAAYTYIVRDLIEAGQAMEDWQAADGAVRQVWLTTVGDAFRLAGECRSQSVLVYEDGAFEAVVSR